MKTTTLLLSALLFTSTSIGGELWVFDLGSGADPKTPNLSLDLNAAYLVDRGSFDDVLKRSFGHGDFGTEIGVSLGLGGPIFLRLDSVIPEIDHASGPFISRTAVSAGLKFRTAIRLDPFAAFGAGYNWDSSAANTHVEAGAEFRFTENVYARAAYRHIFESRKEGGRDHASITAGIGYRF